MYNIDDKTQGHWVKGQGQPAMAIETQQRFQSKLAQILSTLGKRTD